MPFLGDLRRVGVIRLLEILAGGHKSGLLRLRSGRDGLDVYLRGGRCEHVLALKGPGPVEEFIGNLGANQSDLDAALGLAAQDELGTLLLLDFLGVSSRERSLAQLRERAATAIHAANTWQKGDFRFEPAVEPLKGRVAIGLTFARIRAAGHRAS